MHQKLVHVKAEALSIYLVIYVVWRTWFIAMDVLYFILRFGIINYKHVGVGISSVNWIYLFCFFFAALELGSHTMDFNSHQESANEHAASSITPTSSSRKWSKAWKEFIMLERDEKKRYQHECGD